jgi:hypothetical protein
MRDWKTVVKANLGTLRMDVDQREEIISELAAHLEDLYQEHRTHGMSESMAFQLCLRQVAGGQRIARSVERTKEGIMNHRTKALWLPGLATLATASILLVILQQVYSLHPKVFWVEGEALGVDLRWLMLLPICGAAGAYLSRSAGGKRLTCLVAGMFPAIIMLGSFCLFFPVGLLERNGFISHHLLYLGLSVLDWTVLPGSALFLGAASLAYSRRVRDQMGPHTAN